jgi:antitoxin (DNA-binding transcriptional repressor) of toxin-antitoxin stability system
MPRRGAEHNERLAVWIAVHPRCKIFPSRASCDPFSGPGASIMPTIDLAHAKAQLTELLDDLAAGGETIIITRHGQAVAKVSAMVAPKAPLRSLASIRASRPGWRAPSVDLLREARDEAP